MKKSILKISVSVFLFSSAFSLSANAFKGTWENTASPIQPYINIEDGSHLQARFIGMGGPRYSADCKAQGDSLHYTITEGMMPKKDKMIDIVGQKGVCKIEKVADHIYFQESLKCTGPFEEIQKSLQKGEGGLDEKIDIKDLKVFRTYLPKNTPRKIQGTDTLSILKKGKVNDAAYLRSAPDVSAKPLNCLIRMPESTGKPEYEGQVIAKGREIFVIAKAKTKTKVQKWDNYWYYVESNPYGGKNCGPGWMFGEFITIE
ncbi:MAG TPA: hypothetical protein PK453_07185 [Leptospiraceae bacterium]|nr:hypothetical protein [Leptospiraceae bacterium]HMY65382.1 hypothetical protein [Leptospiraceae bacterium]HNF13436.1 hypothetical protein [Leptospiraceae bacterium]HNF26861.1 hypothetical protein [Leptospiraceae bacterium]HNH09800.1 hypothetical protein [Leptospiraceae bacterium]